MKLTAYHLNSLFVLFFCLSIRFYGQKSDVIFIKPAEYKILKKEGKLLKGVKYEIERTTLTTQKNVYKAGNNEIMTVPCGSLPALNYNTVLFNGFGFPDSLGDDACTMPPISLGFNFCFFGTNYNALYINSNGNVTFGNGQTSFSSSGIPNNMDQMIAPFWADYDNSNGNGVVRYSMGTYGGGSYFAVKWDHMGYYPVSGDKLNTCTLIITDGISSILPSGTNVGFFYEDMNWTTGAASGGINGFGGTPGTAGINKGDGMGFVEIGGFDTSGTQFLGDTSSNNGVDWLDNKSFFFNICSSTNIAPVAIDHHGCDTVAMCGTNDTLLLENNFLSAELGQVTTINVSAPTLGSAMTIFSYQPGNSAQIINQIISSPALVGYHNITITASDDGTPTQITTINIVLNILNQSSTAPVLSAYPAQVCPGGSSIISLVNESDFVSYVWNNGTAGCCISVNGPGTNLITVKDSNNCIQTKSIDLFLAPIPTPFVNGNLSYCATTGHANLQLATPDSSEPNYSSIVWMPGNVSGNSFIATAGIYTVTVTGDNTCISDTSFIVTNAGPPMFTAGPDLCLTNSSPVQLDVNFNGAGINSCGLSANFGGISHDCLVGTDSLSSNDSYSFPSPYGNYYRNSRHQFLVLASELTAMGAAAGNINSISFNVTATNGISALPNFTIKLKCTNLTELPAQDTAGDQFVTGTIQVYSASSYSVLVGMNTHVFTQPYSWDGISNLIVETCFDQTNPSYTYNASVTQSNTAFISSIVAYSDGTPVCTSPVSSSANFNNFTKRPNMSFNFNLGSNASNYTYSWTPTAGISNPNIINPILTPLAGVSTYTVTVSTLDGVCTNTATVNVNVDPNNPQITLQPLGDTVCFNGTINLNIGVSGSGFATQWYKDNIGLLDGGNISGVATNNLTISNAQISDEGWYKCEIIGNCSPFQYTDSVMVKVDNCDLIKGKENKMDIILFPNPTKELLIIQINSRIQAGSIIEIYNSIGEKVMEVAIKNEEKIIVKVDKLSSGIYSVLINPSPYRKKLLFVKE